MIGSDYYKRGAGQRGTVLLGLIVTMIVLSVLGAAMLSLFSTNLMGQLMGNSAMKAYYLAESGYRYAMGEIGDISESAKDAELESMHNKDYTLSGNDGKFHIGIYPYYYKTTADPGGASQILNTRVSGGFPPEMSLTTGWLKIENIVYQYSNAARSDDDVAFTNENGNWPSIDSGTTVLAVSHPDGPQTVSNDSDTINLETTTGSANAFPALNGNFRIYESHTKWSYWTYKRRNGSILEGVAPANNPGGIFSTDIGASNNIVLDKFIKITSTGIIEAGSLLETKREVTYHVPIPETMPTEKVEFLERFEEGELPDSFSGGPGEVGGHEISDGALHVTSTEPVGPAGGVWSRIYFDWDNTIANLEDIWEGAGFLLSYDLQVKIKVDSQPYYMAGMSFRETGSENYGVSYIRARRIKYWIGADIGYVDDDDIPSGIKPPNLLVPEGDLEESSLYGPLDGWDQWQYQYSKPAIVLWQKTGGAYTWLAYKILTADDQVVFAPDPGEPEKLRLTDWSNLQVRLTEAYQLEFKEGGPSTFLYGDTITIMRGTTRIGTARVNGTPILTSDNWAVHGAAGLLTLSNVELEDGMTILLNDEVTIYGSTRARVAAAPSDPWIKTNFIRVFYGDVDEHPGGGPFNDNPLDTARGSNPRITDSGEAVHWPVDNVSEWAADNDYMTLVTWDGINDGSVPPTVPADDLLGTGKELGAVIRTDSLTTADSGTFDQPEIALHTFGDTSSSLYFDDFAIQTEAISGSRSGVLPPVQQ